MYKCTNVQLACFLLNINKICRKKPVYNSVSPCTIQPAPPLLTPPFRAKKPTCRALKTAIFRNTSPKKAEKSPSPHRRPLDTSRPKSSETEKNKGLIMFRAWRYRRYFVILLMITRNCYKKYNLCRNDAVASPFGKGKTDAVQYSIHQLVMFMRQTLGIGRGEDCRITYLPFISGDCG